MSNSQKQQIKFTLSIGHFERGHEKENLANRKYKIKLKK